MLIKIVVAMSVLSFVSCGQDEPEESTISSDRIDPEFQPYVERFESFFGSSIGAVSVNFGSIDVVRFGDDAAGYCQKMNNGRRQIIFDRKFWYDRSENMNDSERDLIHETLVFHELGHCILGRDHRNSLFLYESSPGKLVSVASSIMYPIVPIPYYSNNRLYYINELFGRDTAPTDYKNGGY